MSTKSKIITAVISLVVVIAVGIIAVSALITGVADASFKISYVAEQVNCMVESKLQVMSPKNEEKSVQTGDPVYFTYSSTEASGNTNFSDVELKGSNDGVDYVLLTFVITNTFDPEEVENEEVTGISVFFDVAKSVSEYMDVEVTAEISKKDPADTTKKAVTVTKGKGTQDSFDGYDLEESIEIGELMTISVKLAIKNLSKSFELDSSYRFILEGV